MSHFAGPTACWASLGCSTLPVPPRPGGGQWCSPGQAGRSRLGDSILYNSSHFYVGNLTTSLIISRFGLVSACGGAEGGGGVFVDRSVSSLISPGRNSFAFGILSFSHTHMENKYCFFLADRFHEWELRGKSTFCSLYRERVASLRFCVYTPGHNCRHSV